MRESRAERKARMTPEDYEAWRLKQNSYVNRHRNRVEPSARSKAKTKRQGQVTRVAIGRLTHAHAREYQQLMEQNRVLAREALKDERPLANPSGLSVAAFNRAFTMTLQTLKKRYPDEYQVYRDETKRELNAGRPYGLMRNRPPRFLIPSSQAEMRRSRYRFMLEAKDLVIRYQKGEITKPMLLASLSDRLDPVTRSNV